MNDENKPVRYDATGRMIRDWDSKEKHPVPKKKPTTGIEPPAYRRDVFKGERREEWDSWSRIVQFDSSLSSAEKKAFHDIFAAEGGMKKAPGGSAVAGILQGTLEDLIFKEKVNSLVIRKGKKITTENLDFHDIKDVYKGFFNQTFEGPAKTYNIENSNKTIQGYQLLGLIGNDKLSSSVADILFREGSSKGSEIIQKAIKLSDPDQDTGRGATFGTMTLQALQKISKEPQKVKNFLEFSADARRLNEKDRNDYFRFRGEE